MKNQSIQSTLTELNLSEQKQINGGFWGGKVNFPGGSANWGPGFWGVQFPGGSTGGQYPYGDDN